MQRRSLLQGLVSAAASIPFAGILPVQAAPAGREAVAAANATTIGLVTAGLGGTFIQIGADLRNVLNGPDLRILPIVSAGSVQNIKDLLWLKGIDIATVQADALAWAQQQHLEPDLPQRIAYITDLFDEEIHILARPEITDLASLANQEINADVDGSGSGLTAEVLFNRLNIPVRLTHAPTAVALERMKQKQLSATIRVVGKPMRLFLDLADDTGFHFLPVPYTSAVGEIYTPAEITPGDYPKLVKQTVQSIAVSAVLAVYNWTPANPDRFRRVSTFTKALFAKFPELLHPPYSPKWREVNLAATVPGWTRFSVATQQLAALQAARSASTPASFDQFLNESGVHLAPEQEQRLYEQFEAWSKQHAT